MRPRHVLLALALLLPTTAEAAFVTYTLVGEGDGRLGDVAFADRAVRLTAEVDLRNATITPFGGFDLIETPVDRASVLIGSDAATIEATANAGFAFVPATEVTVLIFDLFENDGRQHQIGAIMDTLAVDVARSFAALVGDTDQALAAPGLSTSAGALVFDDLDFLTFTQDLVPIPLPASIVLLGSAVGLLGIWRRR